MKIFASSFLFLSLLATSALAGDQPDNTAPNNTPVAFATLLKGVSAAQPICYGREYSDAHLTAFPAQTVKTITVKVAKDPTVDANFSYLDLTLQLKGDANYYKLYHQQLICDSATGVCAVECDGGNVKVWGHVDGTLAFQNNGIVIDGGCGEGANVVTKLVASKNGDDYFRLDRLPDGMCAANSPMGQ